MEHRPKVALDNPNLRGRVRHTRRAFLRDKTKFSLDILRPTQSIKRPVQNTPVDETNPIKTIAQHDKHLYVSKLRPDLPKLSRSKVLKRQGIKKPAFVKKTKPKKPLKRSILALVGVMLLIGISLNLFKKDNPNSNLASSVLSARSTVAVDDGIISGLPSEVEPITDLKSFVTEPNLPRYLIIEKLNIIGRVKPVGLGNNNVIKSPANIFDIGWLKSSVMPGEKGVVIFNGHISGPSKHGIFYNLTSVAINDKIKIERGDGKVFSYSVVKTQSYESDNVDTSQIRKSYVPGKNALNIISSTGRFNVRTNKFEKRIAVFAIQDN